MIRKSTLMFALLAAATLAAAQGPAFPTGSQGETWLAPEGSSEGETNQREEAFYRDGRNYMDENEWDKALGRFSQVIAIHGRRADESLYWKAKCLEKLGRQAEALQAIAEMRRQYPKSTWLEDADALEVEIRAASGQPVNPGIEGNDDLVLLALNNLMNMDCQEAVPILDKFLKGNKSEKLKERALFVLVQHNCPQGQQLMLAIAKGSSGPALQQKAIE